MPPSLSLSLAVQPENREAVESCAGWGRALTHRPTPLHNRNASSAAGICETWDTSQSQRCPRAGELNLCVASHACHMSRGFPWSLPLGGTHPASLPLPPGAGEALLFIVSWKVGSVLGRAGRLCSLWVWERDRGCPSDWSCCLRELPWALVPQAAVTRRGRGGGRKWVAGELHRFVPQTRSLWSKERWGCTTVSPK